MSLCSSCIGSSAGIVLVQQHRELLSSHAAASNRSSGHKYYRCRSLLLAAWLRWQHGRAIRSNGGSLSHSTSGTAASCVTVASVGFPVEGTMHEGKCSTIVSSSGNELLPGGAACIGAAAGAAVKPAELRKRGRPPKRSESPSSVATGLPGIIKAESGDAALAAAHKHRGRPPKQERKQQAAAVETASAAAACKAHQVSALDNCAVIKRRGRPPKQQTAAAAITPAAVAAAAAGVNRERLKRRPRQYCISSASMQAVDEQHEQKNAANEILSPVGLPAAAARADEGITVSLGDAAAADTSARSGSADGSSSADRSMPHVRHMRRTAKRSVVVAVSPATAGVQEVPAASSAIVSHNQEHAAEGQHQNYAEPLPAQAQARVDAQPDRQQLQQQDPTGLNVQLVLQLKPGNLQEQQQQQQQLHEQPEQHHTSADGNQQQQLAAHEEQQPLSLDNQQQLRQQGHAEVPPATPDVGCAVWEGSEDSYSLGGSAAIEPNRDSLWDVNADRVNIVQRLEQALNIPAAPYSAVNSVLGSADQTDILSSGEGSSGTAGAQSQHVSSVNGMATWQQQQGMAAPNGFKVSTTISGHRYNGQMPLGFNALQVLHVHEQQQQVPDISAGDASAVKQPQDSSSSSFLLRPGRAPLESSPVEPTPPDPPPLVHPELAEASQLMAQRTQKTQQLLEQIQQIESVAQAKLSSPEMQALLVVARLSDEPAVAKWLQADPQVLKEGLDQLSQLQAYMQQLHKQRQQLEAKLADSKQQAATTTSSSQTAVTQSSGSNPGNVTGAAAIGAAAGDSPAAAAASSADIAAARLDLLQSILPEMEALARQQGQEADY